MHVASLGGVARPSTAKREIELRVNDLAKRTWNGPPVPMARPKGRPARQAPQAPPCRPANRYQRAGASP